LKCKTPHRSGFYFAGPALEGTTCGKNEVSVTIKMTVGIVALQCHVNSEPCVYITVVPGWRLCADEEEETPCEGGTRWLE